MGKNRKPRRNQPQPNVATAKQFVEAMEYITAHNDTVQALYSARTDRSDQCFIMIDNENSNNAALIKTLTDADADGVAQYVRTCRADGIRPWILVLVPDSSVKTLAGIDATGLRAGLGCRPNLIPVVAVSLPAYQVFGWMPEVTEARPQAVPSVN